MTSNENIKTIERIQELQKRSTRYRNDWDANASHHRFYKIRDSNTRKYIGNDTQRIACYPGRARRQNIKTSHQLKSS